MICERLDCPLANRIAGVKMIALTDIDEHTKIELLPTT